MGPNKRIKIGLSITVLIIFSSFILNLYNIPLSAVDVNNTDETLNDEKNEMKSDKLKPINLKSSQSSLTEYSGIGIAQNVTESSQAIFQKNEIDVNNNENVSIIVPEDWTAHEINVVSSNIVEYESEWINETFDYGYKENYWTNYTDRPENVTFSWYDAPTLENNSLSINFEDAKTGGSPWNYVNSYYNFTFNLPHKNKPYANCIIDFNYLLKYSNTDWLPGTGGNELYCALFINGLEYHSKQSSLNLIDNNTWYQDVSEPFVLELYNLELPGRVSFLLGVDFANTDPNPTGWMSAYFDNVSLKFSTIPKPSHIGLNITDYSNSNSYLISDLNYGSGNVQMNNEWAGETGGKTHYFSFISNSTGTVFLNCELTVNATSSKSTQTILGQRGSSFVAENNTNIIWKMYFPLSMPGVYTNNYYFNVSKPLNWNITQVLDPYEADKINDVIGAGYGNTTLTIPNSIITNGIWKIIAEAPNYVEEAKIYKDVASQWQENNTFQVPQKIKINASINTVDNPNIDTTNATVLIYYPNGMLWYQQKVSVDPSGIVEFKSVTLGGKNTTIGQYTVHVIWNNDDLNMSQVGLKILTFEITKDSLLKRSEFHTAKNIPAFSGDNLLLKVNFTDLYTGVGLADATVNYTIDNATAITGFMIYQGGGIYLADIDTTGLLIGVYNVTVSAIKPFYTAQNNLELFEIEIQLYTTLERYESPVVVEMNDNATVKYRYKDSYGTGISGATLSFNINIAYIVSLLDIGDGNYTIVFNVRGYSNLGTNQFIANFSATGSENQINILQFEIIEQDVDLFVSINSVSIVENSLVDVYFKEQINISARSFASIDNEYLKGGVITWISNIYEKNLTEGPDTYFNLSITMDGAYFNPGLNYIYLRFQQANYTTKTFSFQLFLRTQSVNITLSIDSQQVQENYLVESFFNDIISLSSRAYVEAEHTFLANCTLTFINGNHEKNLTKSANYWYNTSIEISTSDFSLGNNYVYIKFTRTNYSAVTFSFQILVKQINIDVDIVDVEDSVEAFAGETITIEIKLTEQFSGKPIEGADISYDWEFGVGEFEEKGDGVYEVELEIPESIEGNYDLELIISKSGSVYKSSEEDLTITVNERELPEYWFWIIIAALSIGVGLLAAISLRAYVFLPRARKKESELLAKTQNFKDMRSIQAIVLIHRNSGLPLYYKTYSFMKHADAHLFSGFVQAITTIGREIAESDKEAKFAEKKRKYAEHMMEIDFKYFYALIYDHEDLRLVLILNQRSSDALREKLKNLSNKIMEELGDSIKGFSGELDPFELAVPSILSKSINLHYKEFFKISNDKALFLKTKKERELSSIETRLFNVLTSYSKGGNNFALESLFKMISEKSEDLIIEAIESLIKRKLIIPTEGNSGSKFSKRSNYK